MSYTPLKVTMNFKWSLWCVFELKPHLLSHVYTCVLVSIKKEKKKKKKKTNNFADFSWSLKFYIIFKYHRQGIKNYWELKKWGKKDMDGYTNMFFYTHTIYIFLLVKKKRKKKMEVIDFLLDDVLLDNILSVIQHYCIHVQ